MRETSASKPLITHRNLETTSKPEPCPCSGKSVAGTYLLATWCPVYRRRDSHLGFRMELENLVDDAKGKGTSGRNREAESTDASARGGLLRSSDETG